VAAALVEAERAEAIEHWVAPTSNRHVIGVTNEFSFLADIDRADREDLLRLALRLSQTPCGPFYQRHISPDRELAGAVAAQLGTGRTQPVT